MIRSKFITPLVAIVSTIALLCSLVMISAAGCVEVHATEYEKQLFSGETVNIDIVTDPDDWQNLLDNAREKPYISADITINGQLFSTVGVRTKGNSSLTQSNDNGRYSLQLNPNKYVEGQSFYGLDSMCLNNLMGDATYMKDAISYDIMSFLDVPSPLYNYAWVTVNGEDHGLFLLLERYDDSFLDRVYGSSTGELYNVKVEMGARSEFEAGEMEPRRAERQAAEDTTQAGEEGQGTADAAADEAAGEEGQTAPPEGEPPGGFEDMAGAEGEMPELPEGFEGMAEGEMPELSEGFEDMAEGEMPEPPGGFEDMAGGFGGGMPGGGGGGGGDGFGGNRTGGGSLVYTDDDPESYSSIFDNAISSKVSDNDKEQIITAIQKLNEGEDLEEYWDVDEILRYLAAHTFVVNLDSYISSMQQNYYLLEREGTLSVLPWDYNLAFGGFTGGSASGVVNFPIDTPVSGVEMEDRPLVSQLLAVDEYREAYHGYLAQIVEEYVGGGLFEAELTRIDAQISGDVERDPTAYFTYDEYQSALEALQELVALRAQSVAGQLDGSVPSTTEAQGEDPDALVDVGELNLNALGSMGGGGGGFGGRGGFGGGGFGRQNATQAAEDDTAAGAEGNAEAGAMPDMAAMQELFSAAQSGSLSDEQKEQLAELGFSESEIERFAQMAGGTAGDETTGENGSTTQGEPAQTEGEAETPAAAAATQTTGGPGGGVPPDGMAGQGGGGTGTATTALSAADWAVYGILAALLIGGILFMACYRRRRWAKSR